MLGSRQHQMQATEQLKQLKMLFVSYAIIELKSEKSMDISGTEEILCNQFLVDSHLLIGNLMLTKSPKSFSSTQHACFQNLS